MARAFNRLPLGKRHEIYAAQLRKQATPAEDMFRAHLTTLGLPYRYQHGFFKPRYRIVDFYIPEQNLVIEIDGECCDRERDQKRDQEFERASGVRVLRLTNADVLAGVFPDLTTRVLTSPKRKPLLNLGSGLLVFLWQEEGCCRTVGFRDDPEASAVLEVVGG